MKGEPTTWRPLGRIVLLVFVAATGCILALKNRVPESAISPKSVVAMPPQVLVYTLDAGDQRAYKNSSARALVDESYPS
jgi:hypothetical protein